MPDTAAVARPVGEVERAHAGVAPQSSDSGGVAEKSGSHLMFGGSSIGHGREKAREAILATPALREALCEATLDALPSKARALEKAA